MVLLDVSLSRMTEADFLSALCAKTDTSLCMEKVFAADDLDFMLFFSSAAIHLGQAPGQANYAAGSAFQDAFALALDRRTSFRVRVMDWGYWGKVGAVKEAFYRDRMDRIGQEPIGPAEAMAALEGLVSGPLTRAAFLKFAPKGQKEKSQSLDFLEILDPSQSPAWEPPQAVALAPASPAPKAGEEMDRLCRVRLFALLSSHGLMDLKTKVAEGLEKWRKESLRQVQEAGFLEQNFHPPSAQEAEKQWQKMAQVWQNDPALWARYDLLDTVFKHLGHILEGKTAPESVLFPGGSMDLVNAVYDRNPTAREINTAVAGCVKDFLEFRQGIGDRSGIRILEIGAGTGGTTRTILSFLAPMPVL